jgi:hypothetical protein
MPYTTNTTLEQRYITAEPSNVYSYALIETVEEIMVSSQLVARWELNTITDTDDNIVSTAELTAYERDQIFNLNPSLITFDVDARTATVDATTLGTSTIVVNNADGTTTSYVYPNFTLINSVNPFMIRRSVDITDGVVNFQPGSRLTSGQLNAAVTQLLFAAQEQVVFGSTGASTSVDLGNESINNLGDVSINTGNLGALLVVGPDGSITDSTSGDVAAVLTVNNQTGNVSLDFDDVGAAPSVHTHVLADITDYDPTLDSLTDVNAASPDTGATLAWSGASWVASSPVVVASGTGLPPTSWTTDPNRRPGDLYVRTG